MVPWRPGPGTSPTLPGHFRDRLDAHAILLAKAVPVTYNPGVSVATNVVNALEHAGRGSIGRVAYETGWPLPDPEGESEGPKSLL